MAHELVGKRVDAIVALATPAVMAAKKATSSIPIVGIGMADPVEDDLASSLARPGGNVTGTTFLGPELVSKRLQLLKEIVPGLSRVVLLWHPHAYGERTMRGMVNEIESAAQSLGASLLFVPADSPADLESAFTNWPRRELIAAREGVDLGGLVSYGVNLPDLSRATAVYLARILKGAKLAELPIQQPTKFELVINVK